MPSLTLGCCIVGALLYLTDKSWSLTCEVCRKTKDNCHGVRQNCYAFLDQCATFQSINHKSGKSVTRKACVQANSCYENITSVDLGEKGIISSKMTCCRGLECSRNVLPFPAVNTTPNGKKCKTCFAKELSYCLWEDKISCKGDHTYCLDLAGESDWGGYGTLETHDDVFTLVDFAMKGCVNPAFCEQFHEGSVYFATLFLMGEGSCKPATEKATIVTAASHRVGFFFQVFAGFLLVEIYA
ncbi:phospholipase A2 inhibitor and Ly6/PLAUR domain-containing protein-like isoform X2 [Pantherophis guttatus]|nr:phospholipase A2 inhibitor and Ly6/PLAUR domain-containing protein-like isoform X2 [Pantherophis guttatus]XP_034293829.1 phospholipase A2 inhibitor and Ly6/PLAUR domain-containing protein-like isoform X2 [Pantherophis guttatus]XP_060549861.1 phospholipase A2 inhibitor and Ly6/PLAUR domain-containing protein-like isoform X2 [Pantherophis guttatus]